MSEEIKSKNSSSEHDPEPRPPCHDVAPFHARLSL